MRNAIILAFVAVVGAAESARGASADSSVGADLAKSECAACHAVGRDSETKSPEPKAPRFIDVAKMPSTTELSIKVFLRSSHRNMPNIMLSDEEVDSMAAYILGLRGK